MAKYGFQLHKQAFRDALCLRYGWTPERLPLHCPCGKAFLVEHAFSCPKGALPPIRHNCVRDIMAHLLAEMCPNVGIEPNLQPLTGESFPLKSTNVEEGARLDLRAQGIWDSSKRSAYFDVHVFNSYAPSNSKSSTKACYRRHEKEKRREYERRILEVEHRTFTPLVMSTKGNGDHRDSSIQKISRANRCKARPILQQNPAIHPMHDFVLPHQFSFNVSTGPQSSYHALVKDIDFSEKPTDLIRGEVRLSVRLGD